MLLPYLHKDLIEAGCDEVAASVEVWDNETDELVGRLYGFTIGKVFIGESMFSRVPSASKIALIF